MFIKITSKLQQALGIATAEQAGDRLAEIVASIQTESPAADNRAEIENLRGETKTAIDAVASRVSAVESTLAGAPKAITEDRVREIAEAAGSRAAVSALAGTGSGVPTPASPSTESPKSAAENLVAAGKFDEAWAADPALREQFPDAKCFAAYERNRHRALFHKVKPASN